jgi:hypothetical protein
VCVQIFLLAKGGSAGGSVCGDLVVTELSDMLEELSAKQPASAIALCSEAVLRAAASNYAHYCSLHNGDSTKVFASLGMLTDFIDQLAKGLLEQIPAFNCTETGPSA